MRDLLFKDLTSSDKKRRILSSSEIADNKGVRSIVRRHFVYIVKDITGRPQERPAPYVYILKRRHTKEKRENFFCRVKGSMIIESGKKQLLIHYMHSLKIKLSAIQQHVKERSG